MSQLNTARGELALPIFDIRRNANQHGGSGYEKRRRQIVESARTCFERSSVEETAIVDITREAGIVRELFYYYFPDKESLRLAVAELYAEDALARVRDWCAEQHDCDWNDSSQVDHALASGIARMRSFAFDSNGKRGTMSYVLGSQYSHADFYHKLFFEIWHLYGDEPALKGLYSVFSTHTTLDTPLDLIEFIMFGLQGYIEDNPSISDETLARILLKMLSHNEASDSV